MAHHDHDAHAHAHNHSAKPYFLTAAALYVGTILTYTLSKKDFGEWSFIIAMAIAFTKGSLVVLFFMHLWDQKGASRLTLAIALLFVMLLILLSCSDVLTRFPLALPPGSFRAFIR
jgi:cytochrome c oxidase subunit 4